MYVRGYLQGSENGRVVTIAFYLHVLYAALPVGSFVESDFFIRILLKVYFDFA